MNKTFKILTLTLLFSLSAYAQGTSVRQTQGTSVRQTQEAKFNTPGDGNPILPGYFADPTVKKFGDTYYIYATTDGSGAGFGPAQCWTSKDFRNWTLMPMNWPTSHWIWAPDVMEYTDPSLRQAQDCLDAAQDCLDDAQDKKTDSGLAPKYYMIYCQPCNLYIGQADTPIGPWHNLLGEGKKDIMSAQGPQAQALGHDYDNEGQPIWVYDRYVKGAITLDGQSFVDDDGSVYVYWGTWGIYKGFGCGVGKASKDLKTFTETRLIPNTEAEKFFEAPFVFKRGGIYYLLYSRESCHNETYHVAYAVAKKPMGPYKYKGVILETNQDGTVHGPGHCSVLQDGNDYYMVYHRHDNPHSNRGFHRQVCIDKLEFDSKGNIKPITPTHEGRFPQLPSVVKSENEAYQTTVTASSYYDDNFLPQYAVDDNNGTLWRPKTMGEEWLQIDLGKTMPVQTVWTQWEYGTQYYQYRIDTSVDGKTWTVFADRSRNRSAGSPKVDTLVAPVEARYVKVTFLGAQKVGYPGALWNVKVFPQKETACSYEWPETVEPGKDGKPIISISADDFSKGDTIWYIPNDGSLGGGFTRQMSMVHQSGSMGHGAGSMNMPIRHDHPQPLMLETVDGKTAIPFDSTTVWVSDFVMPELWRDNVPYHLEAELYNPTIEENECVADFTSTHDELEKIMLVNGTEPRCGVMNHYGWFEDAGYKNMASFAGKWQHVVIDFDGRIEKVYINDMLISEKDLQLMVKPVQEVVLGRNAEHQWPFTGYVHSIELTMK